MKKSLLCIKPNDIMISITSGIEPDYQPFYIRKSRNGGNFYRIPLRKLKIKKILNAII